MKSDVSNKTLVGLLMVALVITVVGTIVSVVQLGQIGGRYGILAGATTALGTGLLNVTSQTAITNNVATINFGNGYINSTCANCSMNSDTGFLLPYCCIGFNNVSSGFLLENTGNVNISINYSCTNNCTAATFVGGTGASFGIKISGNNDSQQNNETGALDTNPSCMSGSTNIWNITSYQTSFPASDWLCGNATYYVLSPLNTQDAGVFDISIRIPLDAPTGVVHNATFTFNAFSSG